MPGSSTIEQIHMVRQINEKTVELNKKSYIALIDIRSAFDTIDRPSLWIILKAAGLPAKIASLFKELYSNKESTILFDGKLSSSFLIQNGVWQGCTTAPELCSCVIEHILNETQHAHSFSNSYAVKTLSDIAFVDDVGQYRPT
ncbi:uncharacterized protein LOC136043609 [Artemia franciscana]|uniref:uncharacterized protein LOC136043609 n=1 Tax=Artemia franciscana TaxID=6661 RepID=UPI0032DA0A8B